MEIIGGFEDAQLEELREELKDEPMFQIRNIAFSYDDYDNIAATAVRFINAKHGIAVELVEQAVSDPIVTISLMGQDGSQRMLASNHILSVPATFWQFYEGLPAVRAAKQNFTRRNN